MAKLRAPLFSIRASGSLAGTISYRSQTLGSIAEKLPTHLDVNSDAQRSHRFLYKLGVGLWNGKTSMEKAAYRSLAVGLPLTAMNVWLREWLSSTPDLVLGLPLETPDLGISQDLSPYQNDLILFGPQWSSPPPPYSLSFDGVDDYAKILSSLSTNFSNAPYTFLMAVTMGATMPDARFFTRGIATVNWLQFQVETTGRIRWMTLSAGNFLAIATAVGLVDPLTRYTLGYTHDFPTGAAYLDGVDVTLGANDTQNVDSPGQDSFLGWNPGNPQPKWPGLVHWFVILSRSLTPAEIAAVTLALDGL